MDLGAVGGGIGEYQAGTEPERKAGGFQGVAAGRDVVHEISLAERQHFVGACQVVLVGRDGAKGQFVAGALGLHDLRAAECPGDLGAGGVAGYCVGQFGVGVRIAGAVGDWDQPTRASDERGHLSACGVVVGPICAGVFDGVGQPASLGLLKGELAVSWGGVLAGGKDVHGVRWG